MWSGIYGKRYEIWTWSGVKIWKLWEGRRRAGWSSVSKGHRRKERSWWWGVRWKMMGCGTICQGKKWKDWSVYSRRIRGRLERADCRGGRWIDFVEWKWRQLDNRVCYMIRASVWREADSIETELGGVKSEWNCGWLYETRGGGMQQVEIVGKQRTFYCHDSIRFTVHVS